MEIIQSKKVHLIRWLRGDTMILQYVDQDKILTTDEYNKIKHTEDPIKQITDLVDMILNKGDCTCNKFLRLLAKDEVNESRPMLRKWIRKISDKPKTPGKKAAKRKADEEQKNNQGAENDTAPKKRRKADPDKPKTPGKKAAKPKADEEQKNNQGAEKDTAPKKRRKADPDKLRAPTKKAAKPKTGGASTLKGRKINQGKPKASAKKADQPKADKPKTPKKTARPKTGKLKASAKKADQPKADKPKTPKKTARPKTDKPKTPTKKTTKPKADVTQHAKPSKKCVKGYIHNVSKVVLSAKNIKYFTALFQEAKTCSKLVVFKKDHQDYVNAENNRTPVKLENIKYERQRTGEKDIVAGWDSKLSSLRKLPFSFDATKKQETNAEHKTIRTILKNPINNQRVHVTVRINKQLESGPKRTRANETHDMTVYAVSDKSDSLDLTVWGKKNLSVGKWYLLRKVSVKEYQGKTTLTTTPQTTIKEVAEPIASAKSVSLTDATDEGFKEVETGTGGEQENNMAADVAIPSVQS